MIWFRRAFIVPLWLALFLLLFVTLVIFRINGTFLNPDFYPEQLREANIYEFVLVDALTSALDEARDVTVGSIEQESQSIGIEKNPLVTSGLTTEDIVGSVNRAIPPEWIQSTIEEVFDEFGHYLTGGRDEFSTTVRVGERVTTIVEEFKALTRKSDAYNLLFDEAVEPAVAKAVENRLPLDMDIAAERLVESVQKIVDPDWVQVQMEAVLDEVTPYLVGETDTFTINIDLSDRAEIAVTEIKGLLREANAYEIVYSSIVRPALKDQVGDNFEIPLNQVITIEVTVDEVIDALKRVAPPEWVQQQTEQVIDDTTAYLVGGADEFETTINLVDNKREASIVLEETVEVKVRSQLPKLPRCEDASESPASVESLIQGCIPSRLSVEEFLDSPLIDFGAIVDQTILEPIPDEVTYTDQDIHANLRGAKAEETLDRIDFVRAVLKTGWTYSDADLRNDVRRVDEDWRETGADDPAEAIDDVRGFLSDGYTFTDRDFRELIDRDSAPSGGESILGGGTPSAQLDVGRGLFRLARSLRWILVLPLVILLAAIGFLGGRGWDGRSIWAGGALLLAAALIILMAGPIFEIATNDTTETLRANVIAEVLGPADGEGDFSNTTALAINKSFDLGIKVVDDFLRGVAGSALRLALIALLMIVGAVFWDDMVRTVQRIRTR